MIRLLILLVVVAFLATAYLIGDKMDEAPDEVRVQTTSAAMGWPTDAWANYTAPETTTTTRPRVRLIPKARTAPLRAASYAGTVNGYPCGGDLPPCSVLACESGGVPTAENPRSSASGLWQIVDGTWAGFGGYARAKHAPPAVQNEKARLLWAGGRGAFHWRSCM